AVVQPRAGVLGAGGDLGCGAPCAQCDGGEGIAHVVAGPAAWDGVAEAESAEGVVAPALDGGVVQTSTRVDTAGADLRGGAARAEVHGGESVAHLAGPVAPGGGTTQPEQPVAVVTPALD